MKTVVTIVALVALVACGSSVDAPGMQRTAPAIPAAPFTTTGDADPCAPSSGSTSEQVPASGNPDLDVAQAFIAPLTLGVNVERGWAWEVGDDYYRYLHDDIHLTHVRLFYPWRPSLDMGGGGPGNSAPDEERFARILDAVRGAIDAGLKVYLDCSDVIDVDEARGIYGHVRNCGQWVADRHFDPRMVAIGPINEHAGADNPTWNPIRRDLHDILRAALPGYVLTTGASGWKGRPDLVRDDFTPFDDLRVVYEWHHYESANADTWMAHENELDSWRRAHGGRPTVAGEAGPGYWDDDVGGTPMTQANWVWGERFDEQLPYIAADRPSLWAVTYGNDYRLNTSDSDPTLLATMVDALTRNAAAIRSALGN